MYPYIKILNIYIPSYGLCVFLAVFICTILIFGKSYNLKIDHNDLMILIATSIGCGMFGGCLLYIAITYNLETIYKHIIVGDLSLFKNSGTVFYGGLIGGLSGAIIVSKLLKINIESLEICVVPWIPLGHAIGRIGCLLAGCCYGFGYKGIFAVSTRFDLNQGTYFPIQAVEAMFNLLIMIVLLLYIRKRRTKYSITLLYLVMYSCLRFILEFFRGDIIRGRFLLFSTSQWISLIIFFACIFLLQKKIKN